MARAAAIGIGVRLWRCRVAVAAWIGGAGERARIGAALDALHAADLARPGLGRFNLVASGRKIAGTSQRWRGGIPPSHRPDGSVLAHMVLFVEADMDRATHVVNRFYQAAGGDQVFDPGSVVSAAQLITPRERSRVEDANAGATGADAETLSDAVAHGIEQATRDLFGA